MTRLVLVLAVVVALVCGVSSASDPTWEFTCSDKPFPLAFYNLAVSPCAYDNATYVNQVGKIPCGTADPAVESNCHRARYTGKPRTSQYGFASTVTSVDGIHAPASVTDQSYQTGICVVGASVTSRLLVTPQDPTEAISTISVSPLIKANSLYVQYLRLIDPSTDAKVAEMQLTTPYASIDYDISVPSGLVSAGKTWALELVSSTSAGKQDICFTDISTFAVTPDVTPGFACGCLEDFTFGSFCAKHSPTDQRKWCHVASDCDGALISERTSRPYKNCDDYPLLSSCQEAVRVDSESARFYGTLENLNNDESRLPETCGFGFKGTRGLWLKALGKNRPIKINTCPISGFPSFSSTAAVFTAQGEVICDSLTCLDSTLFTKQQRFTCGDKIASDLEFFGRKGVWYYIWIGPDGAPFDFIDADSVLYGGNFDVSVIGASEWLDILNPPTEEEVVVRDPIVYSPDKYEIVDGNCRKGYILNVTLNTACGSLDPNCERYIRTCTDIDECADPTLHNCHRYAICTNTAGSFTCKCTDAFVDDGTGTCVEKPSGDLIEIKRQKEIADGIEMSEKLLQDEYGSVESDAALKSLQSRLNYLETTAKENLGYWQALAETASAKRDLAKSFVPLFDTFPNIGFLGRGYDMFLGNPLSEKGVDPGFRLSVIDMVYSGMVSRDGGFSVPDLVDVTREPYAHFDSNAKLITTESEYQSTATSGFKLDVSVGGSYEGASVQLEGSASFSLNKEHQNTLQTISKADSVFVQIVGRSIVYRARLEDKTPEKLSDGFVLFVESLDPSCEYETGTFIPKCVDEEEQKYQQVIELYGTHYTTEVVMGGRAFERYTMDQSDMTNIQSQMASTTTGLSVEASAKISSFSGFLKTEGEISSRFSSSVRNYLKTQNVERKQWYLGGSAGLGDNENGNTESVKRWAATVVENPVPVSTVVAPIPVLLTSKQFPNDPSIDRKRRHLFEVLYNACNRKGGENCGQYLERPTLDESDLTIARFGDFFEVVSKAYPSLPANTQMQLFQGATNQGSSSVEYYPIKITSFTTDPSTGVVSFSDGASFDVKSPFLESSSLQCYCDSTGVTSELVFRFQVANSAGSSKATLSPTFVFQDLAGTVTENADYKEDQLNTDGQSFTKSGDYFAITKGSLTNIKLNLTLTGTTISDVVTIGSFSALWRGQEHSFTGLLTCTSESKDKFCTATLSNPTVTGSTPYLCSSLENKLIGDASSANACQNSCRNQVIPPPSATACRYYAFFDTLSRCVLADRTDTPTVVQVSGFKGSVSLRCSGTPPASIPDSNKSAAAGNFNVLQFPASKFTKFQILSPFLTYNEARRPIFYGDSFFFASANGGITARSGTTNLLSAEPLVTVDSENKVVYKDASTLNYLTFRILSETVPIGEPVRTTDLDVLFEVKSGFYTIIFNRLSVVLLGVNPSTDRLFPVTVQSPTDLVKGRFRLVAVNGKDLAPSREDLALILGQPQMNVEVLQVQNTWLWITANFSEDVRRPDGGKLRVKDFVAKVSDSPNGGNSITCVLSSYQSTPNERSANIFNMKVDCAPGNVVPGRQLTLTASAYSVGSYPKPVLPTTIEIKDDRPNYYVGRTIFRDDTTTNQLDSQIFFKYHIITDDNQELANRGTTAGGRYSITDSFGRNVDCTVTWNSPTGSILGVSCPNVKKGEEENVVFALLYPCSLRMVLPSSTARLCDDANLQSLAFPLTPYLTAITTAQGVPSTRITIRDGLAKTLDGQIFTPLSATDVTISGPKTQVNFNACTSSAACSKSLASIDIAGVQSGTTTFAINDPCSSQLWSRTLNKYSPLCFDASLQNAFLSQTITLFQQA